MDAYSGGEVDRDLVVPPGNANFAAKRSTLKPSSLLKKYINKKIKEKWLNAFFVG